MVLFSGRKVLEKIVVELLLVGNCLLESVFHLVTLIQQAGHKPRHIIGMFFQQLSTLLVLR